MAQTLVRLIYSTNMLHVRRIIIPDDDRELYHRIPLLLVRTRDGVSRRAGIGLMELGKFLAQTPEFKTYTLA